MSSIVIDAPSKNSALRTLLLEDDETTLMVFARSIRAMGHDVIECKTIEEGMQALKSEPVELLILDLIIGESNCLGLAQYANQALPDAEIVIVTGSNRFSDDDLLNNYEGISWVLRKPLPMIDLEAMISFVAQKRLGAA